MKKTICQEKDKYISFTESEKNMIMNAYKYVYTEKETESPTETTKKNECVLKTVEILNIARSSVYKVLKEQKKNENLSVPKVAHKANYKEKLDDFTVLLL
ncbi:unnamed protein product [Euphydryas editha]|uniref:Transposase n=1 Tax=Euphydryas editha TaxID=104508 RepID=A0AAU9V6U6_EUPED|nr:unnamed protein product [Euphydryas editha]